METTVLLEVQVKPEKIDEMKQTLREMLVATRAYDGCIRVDVIHDQDKPGSFILVQKWRTRGHYEKYGAWRAETGMAQSMAEKLQATFSLRYFESVAV
jgi:quinol monooxygenase YgiN